MMKLAINGSGVWQRLLPASPPPKKSRFICQIKAEAEYAIIYNWLATNANVIYGAKRVCKHSTHGHGISKRHLPDIGKLGHLFVH